LLPEGKYPEAFSKVNDFLVQLNTKQLTTYSTLLTCEKVVKIVQNIIRFFLES